ncbi:glycosyltransferase [Cohnella terricola]|uniref:Glycosyltransferase family 2 protein n=1 Tax=Cohnella terricola TaxID=1289167 RepID=A0A559JB06_9BACL|nr:glycosyltransferase family 2 protein [Cohnella terricola]TVX97064.1 glycosyltransferase family 2 protein [Cohnella terricola]
MKVSIILPTLNAELYISVLVSRLRNQTLPPHEIIVVDSNSEDNTVGEAQKLGATILSVERNDFDHGGTRNFAASHAKGDILVFMTQDALPESDTFIEELIAPFSDPKVAAAYGRQIARPEATPIEQMTREFNYPDDSKLKTIADVDKYGIKTFFFSDVCSAIRKDVFVEVGGFPEPIISNEDMIYAAKCILKGYSIAYASEAAVLHSHQYKLSQEFRRNFDIGVSLKMNDWIFQYARPEGEGLRLIKAQLRYLCRPKLWIWLPRWFAESVAKFLGYRMGLSYRRIPRKIVRKFSMHRMFWRV